MAIQYVFIKVTGTSASLSTTMTDEIYDAGGDGVRGYYRCIDAGSVAGERFNRDDMKSIIDNERFIWEDDPTNRSTLLYWDGVNSKICINLLGWASKNVSQVAIPTPTSYIEGIMLRQCVLSKKEIPDKDTYGTLTNTIGASIYLVEYGVSRDDTVNGKNLSDGVTRVQPSLMIYSHEPSSNDGDAHVLYANATNRQSAVIWKNGEKLSGMSSLSFSSIYSRSYTNNTCVYTHAPPANTTKKFYSSMLRPTKTVFSPTVGEIDSLYTGVSPSEASAYTRYGAADSLCLDGSNTLGLYMHQNSTVKAPTKIDGSTAYISNKGQADIFGLIKGGVSVNASFWIPTLHGATATTATGTTARFSTVAYNATSQAKKGLGGFMVSGAVSRGNVFTTDEQHSVCIIVKKVDGSFKYSWSTTPLTLKFRYSSSAMYSFGGSASAPVFADMAFNTAGYATPNVLCLDISNICDDFHLDYSGVGTVGSETGAANAKAIRYRSGIGYFASPGGQFSGFKVAKLGSSANIPHINGASIDATSLTREEVFYGAVYTSSAQITAVYPNSG